MNILVSGSTGQLGSELKHISKQYPAVDFDFKSRGQFDLSSKASIIKNVNSKPYDYIINAGAYTAVDAAEQDAKTAAIVNSESIKRIAEYCDKKTRIIHISSDYVYDHNPGRPLIEKDKTTPQGIYAKTKLEGEVALLKRRPDSIVIRTSWVYSSYGKNFVKTMMRLGKERDNLSIVGDQWGTPTYARDIATSIMHIITCRDQLSYNQYPKNGIFNFSNLGVTNWANFAREIFKIDGIKCVVGPISTEDFGAPAPRPKWSVMSKEKIQSHYQLKIDSWQNALRRCMKEL